MISQCPSCKKQIEVPETALGKKVRCSGCQAVFVIEASPAAPQQPRPKKTDPPPPPRKADPPQRKKRNTDAPKTEQPPAKKVTEPPRVTEPPAKKKTEPPKKKLVPKPASSGNPFDFDGSGAVPVQAEAPKKKKSAVKPGAAASGNPFAFDAGAPASGGDSGTEPAGLELEFAVPKPTVGVNRAERAATRATRLQILTVILSILRVALDGIYAYLAFRYGIVEQVTLPMFAPAGAYCALLVPILFFQVLGIIALKRQGSRILIGVAALANLLIALFGCYGLGPTYYFHSVLEREAGDHLRIDESTRTYLFALGLVAAVCLLAQVIIALLSSSFSLFAILALNRADREKHVEGK